MYQNTFKFVCGEEGFFSGGGGDGGFLGGCSNLRYEESGHLKAAADDKNKINMLLT